MTKNKPIQEVRIGRVRAAIWTNETEGGTMYSVTFSRLYKEREGDTWKDSSSFGRDDLLLLAKVADRAHTLLFENPSGPEQPEGSV